MEAEDLRHFLVGHGINHFDVLLVSVFAAREQIQVADCFIVAVSIARSEHFFRKEIFKQGHEDSDVCTFGYSPTIVASSDEVLQCVERHPRVFVDEVIKLAHRYLQVRNSEEVILIPSERAIVTTLEQNRMEHGQSKGNLFQVIERTIPREKVRITQWLCLVAAKHI